MNNILKNYTVKIICVYQKSQLIKTSCRVLYCAVGLKIGVASVKFKDAN